MTQIKFGTDGWRGLIADDFTFENVRRVAGAIARYVLKHEDPTRGIVVGYDTRFLSDRAARAVAEVIAGAGIPVRLANDYVPTPAVSYNVKKLGAAGGVMVTSSHNPWNWNGVKFKAKFGGSATPAIMKSIEDELDADSTYSTGPHTHSHRTRTSGAPAKIPTAKIEEVDLKPAYVEAVSQFADLDLIRRANFKFAIDSMYGSGRGVLTKIFDAHGIRYVAIRQEVNPLFPGINPEPILPHVALLQETVVKEKCHAGLVTDGDADRIGAVAEDGTFVDSHKCFAVLLKWLLVYKKWPGDVVRAFNTSGMIDRIAAKHGRKLHETSIGFKYIADLMMDHEILIGGEESGGIGYGRFLPERDGILNALLLANVMAEEKKPLGQLVADLQREFGAHYYGRRDLHISDELKDSAIRRAGDPQTTKLGAYSILRKENRDGVKFFLDAPKHGNGADPWVLFRASGTEHMLRCYVEAATPELVAEILETGEQFVKHAQGKPPERDRIVTTPTMMATTEIAPVLADSPESRRYNRIKRWLGIADFVIGLGLLVVLLATGWTGTLRDLAERGASQNYPFAVFLYVLMLTLISKVLGLPLEYYGFRLEHRYNLSNQRLRSWLWDECKSLLLGLVMATIVVELLYMLIRQAPQYWWVIAWAVFLGLVVLLAQVAPVVLFPIFYKFEPLENEELKRRLIVLSERAGTRVRGVYKWHLSEKSKKANAALTGLGATRRIILADTLLDNYSDDEIEAVLAHELGHHVHRHILKSIFVQAGITLFGFWLANNVLSYAVERRNMFEAMSDFANLPLLILVSTVLSFLLMPALNAYSRFNERQADRYCFQSVAGVEPFISAMNKLAEQNLAEKTPSRWVEWLLHSHPAIVKRVAAAEAWAKSH